MKTIYLIQDTATWQPGIGYPSISINQNHNSFLFTSLILSLFIIGTYVSKRLIKNPA